jgi:TonB family protein
MSDHLKNNEHFSELIRYRNNKMTDQEQYQFERVLERDPFLAEALEGFEEFKSVDFEKDLNSLDLITGKKRFNIRIGKSFLYTAAASVALLLVVFLFFQHREANQLARSKPTIDKESLPIIDSALIIQPTDSVVTIDSAAIMLAQASESKPIVQPIAKEAANRKSLTEQLASKTDTPRTARKPAGMPAVVLSTLKTSDEDETTPGQVADSGTDQSPVNDVNEGQISEESSNYQVSQNKGIPESLIRKGVNAQPQPLGGFELFKQYVDKELVYPASEDRGSRQTIKVRFSVSTTGQLKNFSIDKSPENADFSREAIRLLQNGPKWAPAVKDGIPVESQTEYRIIFRPE